VVGYVLATVLGQVQALGTESSLQTTSEALFPAAQQCQDAESAFQRMVKGFSDAVMTQDAAGLERATEDGRFVVTSLKEVAAVPGLARERADEASKLASSLERFTSDAKTVYAAVLANPASMMGENQERMRDLASRTDSIKASLRTAREQSAKDLHSQLGSLRRSSAQGRWLALGVFGVTLALAGIIVTLTIRRSITGPILKVVRGVRHATDETAEASGRVADSGHVVARDAQEQAACIEETSASLEEISATTEQNARRATEADNLMRNGIATVERAAKSMDELTKSMDAISQSSNQVAAVLKNIDEIAFQTNILALNAAVEAARAGEAGAGFSVVADEVRALAQRAADASRKSAAIVEKTISDVATGARLVAQSHTAFQEVSSTIVNSSQVVSQIAASSQEQARGVDHIGQAISKFESVTQSNAANAQQTADNAAEMTTQVETTRGHLEELASLVGLSNLKG